jgi:tRNA(fMet)-specific endonuclease VapC
MSGYMLDSNVLVDVAREPDGVVGKRFQTMTKGHMGISVIVSGEIRYGMKKRPDARSNPSMAYLLSSLRIDELEPEVGDVYGDIRVKVERIGKGLSPNGLWIAAHAIVRDAVLVTSDAAIQEADIAGLKLENWRDDIAGQERN